GAARGANRRRPGAAGASLPGQGDGGLHLRDTGRGRFLCLLQARGRPRGARDARDGARLALRLSLAGAALPAHRLTRSHGPGLPRPGHRRRGRDRRGDRRTDAGALHLASAAPRCGRPVADARRAHRPHGAGAEPRWDAAAAAGAVPGASAQHPAGQQQLLGGNRRARRCAVVRGDRAAAVSGSERPVAAGAKRDAGGSLRSAGAARGGAAAEAGLRPVDPPADRWRGCRPDGSPDREPDLWACVPRCVAASRRASRVVGGNGAGHRPVAGAGRWRPPAGAGFGMSDNGRLSVALAQIDPALGDRGRNLERHRQWVEQAAETGASLLVFPELSLTGYFLKDLVPDSAIQLDSKEMRDLAALSTKLDVVLGAVIESPDHRYFNASLYFSRGERLHVHRKVYLPTYGMLEEQGFFAPCGRLRRWRA